MKLHGITYFLLIIGGLNWLLIGIADWGIGDLFKSGSWIAKIIYILVGLSAIYELFTHKSNCKACVKNTDMGMSK